MREREFNFYVHGYEAGALDARLDPATLVNVKDSKNPEQREYDRGWRDGYTTTRAILRGAKII